jgi:hypothetical protein
MARTKALPIHEVGPVTRVPVVDGGSSGCVWSWHRHVKQWDDGLVPNSCALVNLPSSVQLDEQRIRDHTRSSCLSYCESQ